MPSSRTERCARGEALRKLAYNGRLAEIEQLLDGMSAIDRLLTVDELDPEDGFAAVHLATIQNHLRVVELLVNRHADVDCASMDGDTPLMWAANKGKFPMCKLLLSLGADVSLKNHLGRNPAEQAKGSKHRQIYEILENREFDVAFKLSRRAVGAVNAAAARRADNAANIAESKGAAPEAKKEKSGLPSTLEKQCNVLGVAISASVLEVRRAYRRLALKHHPDKNPGDEANATVRFEKIAVALEVICKHLATDTNTEV